MWPRVDTPLAGSLDALDEQLRLSGERLAALEAPPPSTEEPQPAEPPPVCIVCMDEAITHAMVPCGHLCRCEACSGLVMASRGACPKCNQPSSMAMRVYGE